MYFVAELEQFSFTVEQLAEAGFTITESDSLVPLPVNDIVSTDDLTPSITDSMSDVHDASFFMDLTDSKPNQYNTYHNSESQGKLTDTKLFSVKMLYYIANCVDVFLGKILWFNFGLMGTDASWNVHLFPPLM